MDKKSKRMKILTTLGVFIAFREDGFRHPEDVRTKINQGQLVECESGPPELELSLGGEDRSILFSPDHVVAIFDAE